MHKITSIFAIVLTAMLGASQAFAFPVTSHKKIDLNTVSFASETGFNFPGIVKLSNCSGSFVRFEQSKEDDLALVLTNGHCVGRGASGGQFLEPGEVLFQVPRKFEMTLLNQKAQSIGTIYADKIIYATMTDTDIGLLQLTQTYRDVIKATGSQPLLLASSQPLPGAEIQVASGYWKRTYSCAIEAVIPTLKEANWTFRASLRYSPTGCDIIGGTSGSPVISTKTGEVVAINNTSNEDGAKCTLNNPCEVDEAGNVQILRGRGYAQQTFVLNGCFDAGTDRLNLNQSSCLLPKPQTNAPQKRRTFWWN